MNRMASGAVLNIGMALYMGLGFVRIFSDSHLAALGYVIIVALSIFSITFSWCRKCTMRNCGCTHIWFGFLTRFYPKVKPAPYTVKERIGKYLYLTGIHLYPLPWLLNDKNSLILFYTLFVVTGIIAILLSCKQCTNSYCSLNNQYKNSPSPN